MKVTFHHTYAYDWEKVDFDDVMQLAEDAEGNLLTEAGESLYTQRDPADILATNIQGDLTRRTEVESPTTTVEFAPFAIELIQAEQQAIGKQQSARSITAELLQNGAANARFDTSKVTDITVEPSDDGLRSYLLEHFGVGVGPSLPIPAEEPTP